LPKYVLIIHPSPGELEKILLLNKRQDLCPERSELKLLDDVLSAANLFVENFEILPKFPRLNLAPIVINEIVDG
jgi:hypothetical protein